MSPMTLAIEGALGVLLLATIFYCWRLERKLNQLRQGQGGMQAAATELLQAVTRAEAAVKALRSSSDDAGRELQAQIEEARRLSDRLGIDTSRAARDARLGVTRW